MKNKYLIGIDPDIDKSGLCEYNTHTKTIFTLDCVSFFSLIEFLGNYKYMCPSSGYKVYLEAGWLNKKSNYHYSLIQNRKLTLIQKLGTCERIAKNVGENHAVGKLIEQFLIKNKIQHELVRPTKKKLKHNEFCRITGWNNGQTNQEKRDAGMLVYGY